MDKSIFKPVGCKENDNTRHQFEDSSSKVYHFVGIHSPSRDDKAVNDSDSEEEIEGRDDLCDTAVLEEEHDVHTPPEQIR